MCVANFVQAILESKILASQITAHKVTESTDAVYAETKRPWIKPIANLLNERKIKLYSHQALATDHIRAGHSVVVSTPTASGKSLIYTLPVLESLLLDPDSRALYLFPLKALAQDQLQSLTKLTQNWPNEIRPKAALYDGDTDEKSRKEIRKNPPQVLITNPEMLHLAILPWHETWTTFLAGLRYIVVDEAHTYRGVFGSNMALVFRRLNRILARYAIEPTYILCTATLGNPVELATNLINPPKTQPLIPITESGSPQGKRHTIFINPTFQAASTLAIDLIQQALSANLRTIVYTKSRKMTELISLWAKNDSPLSMRSTISAYRAGFLPEERRDIEEKMAKGELRCVVSTSALELGIDIGDLDVCILVGYPGTVMSTLQRGGRVGRASQESVVICLAIEDALDQYIIANPNDFFSRPPEKAIINPDNTIICQNHIECAAQESPLRIDEAWLTTPGCKEAIANLRAASSLLPSEDGLYLITNKKNPQRSIHLRSAGSPYSIEDQNGRLIGSIDFVRASHETHVGAVYLHRGKSYVIQSFDMGKQRIIAQEETVPWYTRIRAHKSTEILEEYERKSLGRCLCMRGRLRITDQVTGYEKRSNYANKLLSIIPLSMPAQIFDTEGIWYIIPNSIRLFLEEQFIHFMGSIHALEHAVIGLLPLQVLADRNDFGGISIPLHPQVGESCVFIYDGIPGGCGLTREAYTKAREILEDTLSLISSCKCEDGCPSCVHSPKCGSGNRPMSKIGAKLLLETLLSNGNEGTQLAKKLTIDAASQPKAKTISPNLAVLSKQNRQPLPKITASSDFLVFDVETRFSAKEVGGWHNTNKMGVSVAVVYDSRDDSYKHFTQDELPSLFALFAKTSAVIGFNSIKFDYKVLSPHTTMDLYALPTLDLFDLIFRRIHTKISLDNLAQATLGAKKSSNGLQALQWWKEGNIESIARYCEQDVRLTKDLYLFYLANGYLLYTAKSGQRVRIDLPVNSETPKA